MFNVVKVEREIGGKTLSLETGKVARQADGAVMVQYGETVVLVAAVTAPPRFAEIDYFPLSVDYRERRAAAGKFPGGFMKREGRPSTKETLTARMIDRPIRPLFPEGYFNEVQIMANVLSADQENDPDVLAMIGASAALHISKIPFIGPMAACRVSRVDGEFIVNPLHEQRDKSDFNLILGGKKEAINMIEVDAKEANEADTAEAIKIGHGVIVEICDMLDEFREKTGNVEKEIPEAADLSGIVAELHEKFGTRLYDAKQIEGKSERNQANDDIKAEAKELYCPADNPEGEKCKPYLFARAFDSFKKDVIRKLLMDGKRSDGRAFDQIRQIDCQTDVLPRAHGSAMFTRGETQAIISIVLGTGRDEQIVDGLIAEYGQKFMLHYNFPPYSVGDVRPIRGPGRREIGHGALAEKALEQVIPTPEDFPYTIKLISDITESNGSSSMASVCGGTLAMMDAGVPIKAPVAGISVGMISDANEYKLMTDIIGEEDHYGDMDFKVAGTTEGITAIQLDIKAEGLEHNILIEALERARVARLDILKMITDAISEPKAELSTHAPKITSIMIDPDFIGKIIGPGGANIKALQEETGTNIEITDDGTVRISCVGGNGHIEARDRVEAMTAKPEIGKIYKAAKIVSVKDFGAFIEIIPGVDGLCHVSELSSEYVKDVDTVCKVGDRVDVKLIDIDNQGRLKLSIKAAQKENQEETVSS